MSGRDEPNFLGGGIPESEWTQIKLEGVIKKMSEEAAKTFVKECEERYDRRVEHRKACMKALDERDWDRYFELSGI